MRFEHIQLKGSCMELCILAAGAADHPEPSVFWHLQELHICQVFLKGSLLLFSSHLAELPTLPGLCQIFLLTIAGGPKTLRVCHL